MRILHGARIPLHCETSEDFVRNEKLGAVHIGDLDSFPEDIWVSRNYPGILRDTVMSRAHLPNIVASSHFLAGNYARQFSARRCHFSLQFRGMRYHY